MFEEVWGIVTIWENKETVFYLNYITFGFSNIDFPKRLKKM